MLIFLPCSRNFARGLLFVAAMFAAQARADADEDTPTRLPALEVKGAVPLVKVAEFTMLERRFGPAAVVHDHYIYIIAGLDRVASDTVERFDVRTGKSEIFARLRIPRFWHKAVCVGDKIYVIGGSVMGAPLPSDQQQAEAMMKLRRNAGAGVSVNSPISSVEIIDLKTGEVSAGTPLPQPLSAFGCAALGNQIAVIGGKTLDAEHRSRTNRLIVYDISRKQWVLGPPMPTEREVDAALAGPFLVVPGGYDGDKALDTVEMQDIRTGKWRAMQPLCRKTSAHSAVTLDKYLFLFGDYEHPNEVLAYDLTKGSSETFTLRYDAARHGATVVVDRKIYVVGGREDRDIRPVNLIQVFALTKDIAAASRAAAASRP